MVIEEVKEENEEGMAPVYKSPRFEPILRSKRRLTLNPGMMIPMRLRSQVRGSGRKNQDLTQVISTPNV